MNSSGPSHLKEKDRWKAEHPHVWLKQPVSWSGSVTPESLMQSCRGAHGDMKPRPIGRNKKHR